MELLRFTIFYISLILSSLSNYFVISLPLSNTCPLPLEAKTGDQSSIHITVYFCYQLNVTAKIQCQAKITEATLSKGLVTNLDYDINNNALLAKFYGQEICVSYRYMILAKWEGQALKNRTSCGLDCFTDSKMVDIEYDQVCDHTGSKCSTETQKLHFVVNSASPPFGCIVFKFAVILIFWLKK